MTVLEQVLGLYISNVFTDNKKRLVILTDSVLLASAWDNNITKKEDREIKDALFQFLKTVHRKVCLLYTSPSPRD